MHGGNGVPHPDPHNVRIWRRAFRSQKTGDCLADTTESHVPIADDRMGMSESIIARLGFSNQLAA